MQIAANIPNTTAFPTLFEPLNVSCINCIVCIKIKNYIFDIVPIVQGHCFVQYQTTLGNGLLSTKALIVSILLYGYYVRNSCLNLMILFFFTSPGFIHFCVRSLLCKPIVFHCAVNESFRTSSQRL